MKPVGIYFLLTAALLLVIFVPLVLSAAQTIDDKASLIQGAEELTAQFLNRYQWWHFFSRTPFISGQLLENLKSISTERKEVMLRLAQASPADFLRLVVPAEVGSSLPPEVRDNLEVEVKIAGRLEIIVVDDFKAGVSETRYSLWDGKQRWFLYFTSPLGLIAGATISVGGFRLGDAVVVANQGAASGIEVLAGAEPKDSTGNQRKLVLLVDFLNNPAPPFTPGQMNDVVFNGQMQNFYREQSYDLVSFSGQTSDEWIKVNKPRPYDWCESVQITDREIVQYIFDHNINLADYEGIIFLINWPEWAGACGTVGQWFWSVPPPIGGNFALSVSWITVHPFTFTYPWSGWHPFDFSNLDFALSHELGHNLGINAYGANVHAAGWDCGEQVLYGNCQSEEYGNVFDAMGYGTKALHFSVYHKELMDWVKPEEVVIIERSGRYTIQPLELAASRFKGAKIVFGGVPVFYLEYRRGVGFDRALNRDELKSNQDGLMVNWLASVEKEDPFLLDMRPTSWYWWEDIDGATLNIGSPFIDDRRRIQIGPVVEVTPEAITFDVFFDAPIYDWWYIF